MSDVVYDAILGAGNTLRQVLNGDYSPNGNIIAGKASGAPDPDTLYAGPAGPIWTGQTSDIVGLLSFVSVTAGLNIAAGTITLPYQKRAQGGTFAGGSSHFTVTGSNGLVYPTQFTASQDDEAVIASLECRFRVPPGSSTTVKPCSVNTGQALAASAFTAQFGFGPITVNGSAVGEAVGWTVGCGLSVIGKSHNGLIYPDSIFIQARDPFIDIVFEDFDKLSTFTADYAAIASAAVYGRRRAAGSSFDDPTSTTHLKLSFGTGSISQVQNVSAQGVNEGQATVRIMGKQLASSVVSALP